MEAVVTTAKNSPKRFIHKQIPGSLLNNTALNASISLLPQNYNFEIHKSIHHVLSLSIPSPRVALQLPEGLLIYSLTLSDIFLNFANAAHIFVLADVIYGLLPRLAKPLSPGEVLGCTAPRVYKTDFGAAEKEEENEELVIVFVADGRFHLEAFMIANPGVKAYMYDPYLGRLFLEEYDHKGMKTARMKAVLKAREARNWGVVLGTLGRQGNLRILERLEKKMEEKGMSWTVVLMSEISPARIGLFEDLVDAWIQIACPRLSIDWGEAEIALGLIPGWWERNDSGGGGCRSKGGSAYDDGSDNGGIGNGGDYPMDYYSQDGGDWNSSYAKGKTRPNRRSIRASVLNGSSVS